MVDTNTVPQTPDPKSTDLLLKVLRSGGTPPMAPTQQRWSLPTLNDDGTWMPGEWWTVKGKLKPCANGLHLTRVIDLPNWIRNADEIYVAEYDGQLIVHDDETRESKIVVKKARLTQRIEFSDTILRLWAADCAEHVLSLYETRYPDDMRPRKAIEAARAYVRGEISRAALWQAREDAWKARRSVAVAAAYVAAAYVAAAYAAAAYAAAATAYVADAAAYAADAADAADADADAAYVAAATRRTEIKWQSIALASLLNLPGYGVHYVAEKTPDSEEG